MRLILALIIFLPIGKLFSQEFIWAKRHTESLWESGISVSSDAEGNWLYSAGMFLIKVDANGELIWKNSRPGRTISSISIDKQGNSYLLGHHNVDSVQLCDTIIATDTKGFNQFLAKVDKNGNCIWIKSFPGSAGNLKLDKSESFLYVFSTLYSDSLSLDGVFIGQGNNFFVAKFDLNGQCLWSNFIKANTGGISRNVLTVDNEGNVIVSGQMNRVTQFGVDTIIGKDEHISYGYVFLAKYSASGKLLWAKQVSKEVEGFRSHYHCRNRGITSDKEGNIYLTGYFFEKVLIDGIELTGQGRRAYIAKYNKNGLLTWVKSNGGSAGAGGFGIDINKEEEVIVGINKEGWNDLSIDDKSITLENLQIVIAKLNKDGDARWLKGVKGGLFNLEDIAINSKNEIAFTGLFYGDGYFDEILLQMTSNEYPYQSFLAALKDSEAVLKVEENRKDFWMVFPNPTRSHFSISFNVVGKYRVRIHSVAGKLMYEDLNYINQDLIDISNFPKGIYIVEVADNKNTRVQKLVHY
jgi:hypothetical protein